MRTVEAREYRDLLEYSARCDRAANEFAGNERAVRMLTALSGQCREIAAVFDREPQLHRHITDLPYCRAIDLFTELARQTYFHVRQVARNEAEGREHPRWPNSAIWNETEGLAERAAALAADATAHAPALRLDTGDGSRALSRRLIGTRQLVKAAETIERTIAKARALPQPDSAVDELARLAERLRGHAAELDADEDDWWTTYFAGRYAGQR